MDVVTGRTTTQSMMTALMSGLINDLDKVIASLFG